MLRNDYKDQNCSIARTLELVGERWTILVLRDVFLGGGASTRCSGPGRGSQRARRASRPARREGILEKVPYQERPLRHEYRLTDKGLDLWPVIVELLRWGDRYAAPAAGPRSCCATGCGGELGEHRICARCGKPLEVRDVRAEPGPGAGASSSMRRSVRASRPARPAAA